MSSFSPEAMIGKLNSLNNTSQSIQTVSLWLIHHRKHAKVIVKVWLNELMKVKQSKKLLYVYLANDIVQNSRKKGPEFNKEFSNVIVKGFKHVYSALPDEKTMVSVQRVLKVWTDRGVFSKEILSKLKALSQGRSETHSASPAVSTPTGTPSPKIVADEATPAKRQKIEEFQKILQEEKDSEVNPDDIPEPEELAQALRDLENSASSDAVVREKIAKLPPEVQDVSLLDKIKDNEAANRLTKLVDEACEILDNYNDRLTSELQDREQVMSMLKNFRIHQQSGLQTAEQKLKEYEQKLNKVTNVRKELKSHIQNLPDLTLLPDVTGGLAPLPSAGDLFSMDG